MKLVKFTRLIAPPGLPNSIYINPDKVIAVYQRVVNRHTAATEVEIEGTCIDLDFDQHGIVDESLPEVVAALNAPARLEYKREFIAKTMTQEFWAEIIENDGPEGIDYARDVLGCIRSALSKHDALDRLLGKPPEKGHE